MNSYPIETAVDRQLIQLAGGAWLARSLAVAARLGIPDLLHDQPRDSVALATILRANGDVLTRLMKLLAACGIFSEGANEIYHNSPLSELLRTDHPRSLKFFTILAAEDYADAFGDLLHSVMTGESAFPKSFGLSIYEHMDNNQDSGLVYDKAMADLAKPVGRLLAQRPEFSLASTVVDIGGGIGALLTPILSEHHHLRGIVAERSDVCARGRRMTHPLLTDRLDFVPTDFFDTVPLGDIYLAKNVLHNWNDQNCLRILGTIARSMHSQASLMIVEPLIESDDRSPRNLMDSLLQAVICESGAHARGQEQFHELIHQVGLSTIDQVRLPSGHSLIVCSPET
ncbi:MAG: methyltransferase [Cyanobacteriota bacterium]